VTRFFPPNSHPTTSLSLNAVPGFYVQLADIPQSWDIPLFPPSRPRLHCRFRNYLLRCPRRHRRVLTSCFSPCIRDEGRTDLVRFFGGMVVFDANLRLFKRLRNRMDTDRGNVLQACKSTSVTPQRSKLKFTCT
jgi:hypothetical protein